jgi:hypothetical protein
MYEFKVGLLVLVTLICSACSVNDSAIKVNDENQFWKAFKQAVLDDNKETIIALTHFPFEVRETDDSDAVKSYEQKDFDPLYERLISQQVYFPEGGSVSSKSMRQLIEGKPQITPGDFITPNLIQYIQFEFERIGDKWFFARAYLEE